jgi:hypothetical protein
MSYSACKRIPIEIWDQILQSATTSLLLPFREDGSLSPHLLDNLLLFDQRCATFKMYSNQTQVTIERLRLVCRVWAQLLEKKVNRFAITNHEGHYYPSEQMASQAIRLDLPPVGSCSRGKGQCKYHAKEQKSAKRSSEDAKRDQEEYVRSFHVCFPSVRILDLDDFHLMPLSCLGTLVNLKALSIYLDFDSDFSLNNLLSHVPRLTRLRLNPVTVNSRPLFEPFSHAGLEYLALDIDRSGLVEEEVPNLVKSWTFFEIKNINRVGPCHREIRRSHSSLYSPTCEPTYWVEPGISYTNTLL